MYLSPGLLALAGIAAFSAIGTSSWLIYRHLRHFSEPIFQRQIVRIIFIVPLFALTSFITLFLSEGGRLWVHTIRDVYEAVVLWFFLQLCVEYMGGAATAVNKLDGER
jgi:hypothetical protein